MALAARGGISFPEHQSSIQAEEPVCLDAGNRKILPVCKLPGGAGPALRLRYVDRAERREGKKGEQDDFLKHDDLLGSWLPEVPVHQQDKQGFEIRGGFA